MGEPAWGFCCRFQFSKTADFPGCVLICRLLEPSCWVLSYSFAEHRSTNICVIKDSRDTTGRHNASNCLLKKHLAWAFISLFFFKKKEGHLFWEWVKMITKGLPLAEVCVSQMWIFFKNNFFISSLKKVMFGKSKVRVNPESTTSPKCNQRVLVLLLEHFEYFSLNCDVVEKHVHENHLITLLKQNISIWNLVLLLRQIQSFWKVNLHQAVPQ